MKKLLLVFIALSGLSAIAADAVTPALKHGLIGFSECRSTKPGHFTGKIFVHEDFLHQEAYAILAGDIKEDGAKGAFAVFLVTNPDMDGKNLTLHLSRDGKRLGTLAMVGLKGLNGTLNVDNDTLTCQPIAP